MTVHLLPIAVSREELDLRLRSIHMPPEAIVVCDMLGPLDELDRRLAGVVWKVIGREVPPTAIEDIPDYPFLRVSHGGAPWRQVQIWEWHICLETLRAFVMYRWHPWGDEQLHFVGLSLNKAQREKETKRLTALFEVTRYRYRLGRPLNSGVYQTDEELLDLIVPIIEGYWREKIRPTQDQVVNLLPRKISDRRLRRLCETRGEPWDAFIERIRQEMRKRDGLF
jgi:hypothetical protein